MTSLKMIVCGDRTTSDVTDSTVTFGDQSSNVYKKAFELLKRNSASNNEPLGPVELTDIPVNLTKYPSGFNCVSVVHKYKQRYDTMLSDSQNDMMKTAHEVYSLAKHGKVSLNMMDPHTKTVYKSVDVPFTNEGNINSRVYIADIPVFTMGESTEPYITIAGVITLNVETGDLYHQLDLSHPSIKSCVNLTLSMPLIKEGIEVLPSIEVTANTAYGVETASIIEDIAYGATGAVYSSCVRPGNRELTPENVIGVVQETEYKQEGIATMYSFIYRGDSAYLINDKGHTLDSIK